MHNNISAIISLYCIISYTNKRYNIIEDNILHNIVDVNIFPYRPDEVAMFGCESLSRS